MVLTLVYIVYFVVLVINVLIVEIIVLSEVAFHRYFQVLVYVSMNSIEHKGNSRDRVLTISVVYV